MRRSARGSLGIAILGIAIFLACAAPTLAASPAWEFLASHAPTNVPLTPLVNEVQTVTVKGAGGAPNEGKFKLEFEDESGKSGTTKPLPYTATAAEVQAALESVKPIGAGNVTVTGGPQGGTGEASWSYAVTFVGALGGRELEELHTEEVSPTAAEEKKLEEAETTAIEGEVAAALAINGAHDTVDYQLVIRNAGGAPTSTKGGRITVTDTLPAGLTLKATPEPNGWTCKATNEAQSEFECKAGQKAIVNPDGALEPIDFEAFLDTSAVSEGQQLVNEASLSGATAAAVQATDTATVSATPAPFGLQDFEAGATGPDGERYTQAGGRPYAATTSFFFNTFSRHNASTERTEVLPPGNVKDADVKLPAGFVGNPLATERCTQAEFTAGLPGGPHQHGACPPNSQVGSAWVYIKEFGGEPTLAAVYNLIPPPGVPAEFGFIFKNVPIRLDAHVVRESGEYRVTVLSADVNEAYQIFGVTLSLWGVPGDPSHQAERFKNESERGAEDTEVVHRPFLTNPVDCLGQASEPPVTTMSIDRWEQPGPLDGQGLPILGEPNWLTTPASSPAVTRCGLLTFAPTIGFKPASTQADEPSGYTFNLAIPQNEIATGLATPELKNTTVTLPEGVSLSPSAANGLEACGDSAIDLASTERGSCPAASQVGTVKIESQLLEKPLEGRVYIGEPECSPCSARDAESGKLFRLFIEAEGSGVRVKLPGTATTNAQTGQVTTTFKDNPQLPFERLELTLKDGPRATLANPQSCGTFTTTADLTPWSAGGTTSKGVEVPGTADANLSDPFAVSWDGAGGACPGSLPFNPRFAAGTESSTAGAYSPFDVTFERRDREQGLSGVTVQTPPGLLGRIAGIPRCAEAQANAGTCPASSRIATATSAAGAGQDPFVVSGPVYLTDGYKGAPFGLSIAVPANAGPFHLGTVIVRAAISVNPTTSALTIASDPLPQSIDGVPFRLKTVKVTVDRPEFMFNPTNCEPKAIAVTLTGAAVKAGEQPVTTRASAPFTASSCAALSFAPTLTASTQANTSKAGGASLTVKLSQHHGEANIRKVKLQLPTALPSRLTTLQKACPEAQFAANPAGCPEASVVGTATAVTPLLSAPLTGPAYLVSRGGAAFPDLVFLLQGEGVHIELVGNTDIKNGITYSRFETVPDAPISSFETSLPEGPHSVLASNGSNLCEQSLLAPTEVVAQNGLQVSQTTKVLVTGCPLSVSIKKAQISGNALLVTVTLSAAGTVKIAGTGLRTTVKRGLGQGISLIKVPLTKAGSAAKRAHKKIKIKASLTVGTRTVTKTAAVRA